MIITPFRWPGAKNKALPDLTPHLDRLIGTKNEFCDVFVGGGAVLLEIALKHPTIQLFANDKDYWMSSFWQIMGDPNSNRVHQLKLLLNTPPTIDYFKQLSEKHTIDPIECAYKILFFNRCCFSGIVKRDKTGKVKSNPIGGKDQKSKYKINCRYNIDTLKSKIDQCHQLLSGRLTVDCQDFSQYSILTQTDYPCYLDPPYFQKGNMLYDCSMENSEHQQLAQILLNRQNWLLSYDDDPVIRTLYSNCQIDDLSSRYSINGKKDNWQSKNELVIYP